MKKIKLTTIITLMILFIFFGTTITNSASINNSNNEIAQDNDRSNAYLQSLSIEGYNIYPEFNKNTTNYYVVISTNVTSLDVTAVPEVEAATTRITGNTTLTKTENTIKIIVTAQNKRTKTYNITVNKQEENGLNLVNLTIENAELSPTFYSGNYHYTAEITTDTEYTDLIVNAEANKPEAEVEIIGNKNLEEGENLVTIILRSENTTSTYEITVNVIKNNIIITTNEDEGFTQTVLNKINEFFSDSFRTIIFLVVIAILLLILIIILITKLVKNKKANNNRKKIKERVK